MRRLAFALALLAAPLAAQGPAPLAAPPPAGSLLGPALHVSSLDRSLRFYTEGLGMAVNMQMGPANRRETMLGFGRDPSKPGIILLNDTTAATPAEIHQSNGFDRIVLRMANLDAVVARLRGLGFTASDVRDVAMGYRMALATDPDGYRFEMVESHPHP